MRRWRQGLLALFLSSSLSLFAVVHPGSGCLTVQAEFLYLYPSLDDPYYVVNSNSADTVDGDRIPNNLGFQPGFRIEALYGLDNPDVDMRIRWAYLHANETDTTTGGNLYPTQGVPGVSIGNFSGVASSNIDFLYQNVEGLLEFYAFCGCFYEVFLQAGIQATYLRFDEQLTYDPIVGLTENDRYWGSMGGVGPQIGIEGYWGCWQVCNGPGRLSLMLATAGSLLVSKNQAQIQSGGLSFLFMDDDATWRIVPFWTIKTGLNYLRQTGCGVVSFEIGYEFAAYFSAVSQIRVLSESAVSFNNYSEVSFQGPYASVSYTF